MSIIIRFIHWSFKKYFCYKILISGQGVDDIAINLPDQIVRVTSTLTADELLNTIKKTGKTTTYVGVKS